MIPIGLPAAHETVAAFRRVWEPRLGSLHDDDLAEIDEAVFRLARDVELLRAATAAELCRRRWPQREWTAP
jgi:hypothetical protein